MKHQKDLEVLRSRNADIAQYIEQWRNKYEGRSFDFKDDKEQADFYEGVLEMARHIAHTSDRASLTLIPNNNGISSLYVNVTPSPQPVVPAI